MKHFKKLLLNLYQCPLFDASPNPKLSQSQPAFFMKEDMDTFFFHTYTQLKHTQNFQSPSTHSPGPKNSCRWYQGPHVIARNPHFHQVPTLNSLRRNGRLAMNLPPSPMATLPRQLSIPLKQCLFQWHDCDQREWYQRYGKEATDQERENRFRVLGSTTAV